MCRIWSMSASEGRGCSLSLMKHWIIGILLCVWFVASTDAAETKPTWQQQWEQIVQGAKKEGQVTVYVHSTYAPVLTSGAFEKAFPDIKLVVVSGIENAPGPEQGEVRTRQFPEDDVPEEYREDEDR